MVPWGALVSTWVRVRVKVRVRVRIGVRKGSESGLGLVLVVPNTNTPTYLPLLPHIYQYYYKTVTPVSLRKIQFSLREEKIR
jgi:hypothetical protein